jgi:hypothetical protein
MIAADTKNGSFFILQRVSDSLADTKDGLPADTINLFCTTECEEETDIVENDTQEVV